MTCELGLEAGIQDCQVKPRTIPLWTRVSSPSLEVCKQAGQAWHPELRVLDSSWTGWSHWMVLSQPKIPDGWPTVYPSSQIRQGTPQE